MDQGCEGLLPHKLALIWVHPFVTHMYVIENTTSHDKITLLSCKRQLMSLKKVSLEAVRCYFPFCRRTSILRTRAGGCLGSQLGFEVCFWRSQSALGELEKQSEDSIPP